MADVDGNVYHTVVIGYKVWTIENLKVSRYRNGDSIPCVSDSANWYKLNGGAFCYYGNDRNNKSVYGLLYNSHAARDSRGLAPQGWHVATDQDWQELADEYKGFSKAGGKLKEQGTAHWKSPNTGAGNESGFTALPGGCRMATGNFKDIGLSGYWTSIDLIGYASYAKQLDYDKSELHLTSFSGVGDGYSVRCVRDEVK